MLGPIGRALSKQLYPNYGFHREGLLTSGPLPVQCSAMLQQKQFDSGAVGFVSPLLQHAGIPHLFSTRIGGISSGPFASLNLGNPNGAPVQDSSANLEENYRRAMAAAGLSDRRLCRVHQVHGNAIAILSKGDAPPAGTRADALLTDCPDFALSMRTADCVPILIASTDGQLVCAVHAGWRGVVAGIVPEVIAVMQQRHLSLSQLLIAIGPSIGLDAFEVGDEVAQEFRVKMPGRRGCPPPRRRESPR